jgi:hypothetical protein
VDPTAADMGDLGGNAGRDHRSAARAGLTGVPRGFQIRNS